MVRWLRFGTLCVLAAVAACDPSDATGPEVGEVAGFVEELDLAGLEDVLFSSAVQVEVGLVPGGLTAREIVVREEDPSPEERISSRAVGLEPSEGMGYVEVMLGDLRVHFDAETRFWIQGDEVPRGAFFEELQAALNQGMEPAIVAERPVPDVPEDAVEGTFVAAGIALAGEGAPSLRMMVDAGNLSLASPSSEDDPDAWLEVLGLRIQLRLRDGTTKIESHRHDYPELQEFEGAVASVRPDAGTVTLEGGTVVRLVDATQISDADGRLRSLGAVAEALEAGHEVVARGTGGLESEEPRTLVAVKIAFVVRDGEATPTEEFEGVVAEVYLDAGKLVLADGTVVRIVDRTEVVAAEDGGPASLEAVAHAMEEGRTVVSWGHGEVESEDPLTLEGLRVVFKLRPMDEQPSDHVEFEGVVVGVDVEAGSLTLESGTVVNAAEGGEVVPATDHSPSSLHDLAEALEAGYRVIAWGSGELEGEEPRTIAGLRIVLKAVVEDFEAHVASVDVEAGTLTLNGGWTIHLGEDTEVAAANDASPSTLAGVLEALEAQESVVAWGWGFVTGLEPVLIDARAVTFSATGGD